MFRLVSRDSKVDDPDVGLPELLAVHFVVTDGDDVSSPFFGGDGLVVGLGDVSDEFGDAGADDVDSDGVGVVLVVRFGNEHHQVTGGEVCVGFLSEGGSYGGEVLGAVGVFPLDDEGVAVVCICHCVGPFVCGVGFHTVIHWSCFV